MNYTIIILCITLWIITILNNKTINEQQKLLDESQNIASDVLKASNEFASFVDRHYNNVVRDTISKELEMQQIIESAKKTKENFSETLKKLEKVLYEK